MRHRYTVLFAVVPQGYDPCAVESCRVLAATAQDAIEKVRDRYEGRSDNWLDAHNIEYVSSFVAIKGWPTVVAE